MATISVVIPTYNAQRTILATIESVQQQTFKDIEIIVINDGSDDGTLEILESIEDRRLKVYSYPNGGLSTARNRGIALAKGEYLSFLDADDLWTPDKLEKQLAALQNNPRARVAYSWVVIMLEPEDDGDINFVSGKKIAFTGDVYTKLLVNNFIGNGSNILIKREAIELVGNFDPSFKSCEDWDYYLRLAFLCHFVVVPEHQILYRKTAGTLSSKGLVMEQEGLRVIDKVYQTVPQKLQYLKNRSIANFYRYCGKIYVDYSDRDRSIHQGEIKLFQAIVLDPLVLLSSDTYVLLVKILLKRLLPHSIVRGLISTLKKPLVMKDFKSRYFSNKQSI